MDKKFISPSKSDDSGYSSAGTPSRNRELPEKGSNLFYRYFRKTLSEFLESDRVNQLKIIREFVESYVCPELKGNWEIKLEDQNKGIIDSKFFTILDLAIQRNLSYQTNLPNNEGASILVFANSCLNKEVISLLLKLYSIEKQKSIENILKSYRNSDTGATILHQLANAIVKKSDHNLTVTIEDWEAFESVSDLVPELKNLKDDWDRTPEEIITEQTNLSLENKECYVLNSEIFKDLAN